MLVFATLAKHEKLRSDVKSIVTIFCKKFKNYFGIKTINTISGLVFQSIKSYPEEMLSSKKLTQEIMKSGRKTNMVTQLTRNNQKQECSNPH